MKLENFEAAAEHGWRELVEITVASGVDTGGDWVTVCANHMLEQAEKDPLKTMLFLGMLAIAIREAANQTLINN